MDVRPTFWYDFRFVHSTAAPIEFPASGPTKCKARAAAFVALEGIIQRNGLPADGWKLEYQRVRPE